MLQRILASAILLPLACLQCSMVRGELLIEVAAGKHDRVDTAVSVTLDDSLKQHRHWTLRRIPDGEEVSVQLSGDERPKLMWILKDPLAAGATRRYRLSVANDKPAASSGVVAQTTKEHVKVTCQGKPVLVYNSAIVASPNRQEAFYDRSGYIHPLFNPRGQVVTDDFAPDHPHQHGLMFPWTNTTFEGRPINFWDQQRGKGRIEHAKVESTVSGSVFGGFAVRLNHLDVTSAKRPKPVLTETWRVRVYNLASYFVFDLESRQSCVDGPLHIQKYHYGGLAIRGHRNWLEPGQGGFLTSENKNRKNGNQSRPRWCDMYGDVEGQATGVTIICDPGNFRAPQPVRLHPQKPYFCFAPMALGGFKIEGSTPYVSRYRFYVHDGRVDPKVADRLWRDLAEPPVVAISSK